MTALLIICGTLSGIAMCYHLMRTAWQFTRIDAAFVVVYTSLVLLTADLLAH